METGTPARPCAAASACAGPPLARMTSGARRLPADGALLLLNVVHISTCGRLTVELDRRSAHWQICCLEAAQVRISRGWLDRDGLSSCRASRGQPREMG